MPLTGDAKRDYQRRKMAERRAKTAESSPTNGNSEGVDRGGEHYWRRRLGEDFVECIEFEFRPGQWVGGCGEQRPYTGKLLSTRLDGGPDLGKLITDSPHYKEIQAKMPVTKDRFGR